MKDDFIDFSIYPFILLIIWEKNSLMQLPAASFLVSDGYLTLLIIPLASFDVLITLNGTATIPYLPYTNDS